ncbi:MAG: HAMP domain-containing sensor histidine kinase [Saprospiraceae bacterium]
MDIYQRRSWQKWYLAILGLAIIGFSLWYTGYIAERLAVVERNNTRFWVMAQKNIYDTDSEDTLYCDLELELEIFQSNTTIPVIIANENGTVDFGANWGSEALDNDKEYLQQQLDRMIAEEAEPIPSFGSNIYFGESKILQQLRFFPLVQFILIGGFILFGYMGVNSARRAEQNRVWVGMAKETAHQLGTPISAIVAWIEHLKMMRPEDADTMEIVEELRNDVQRLELIAERFSKIGSTPTLEEVNVFAELDACRQYMQKRASRKVTFDFPSPDTHHTPVKLNPPLFDWVVENLLRNALDAMDGQGHISASVTEDRQYVHIDITDTGKGIPASHHKRVFEPGSPPKKEAGDWGLASPSALWKSITMGKFL